MNQIESKKLDDIINKNIIEFNSTIHTNQIEIFYNYMSNLFFDNFILIIIFYFVVLPYLFTHNSSIVTCIGCSKKQFNSFMLIIIPLIIIGYYNIKLFCRKNFKIGNILRTNECLNTSNHIIINKTIKPIETKIELLDKPLNEFFINTSHNTYIPCTQNLDIASTEAIKRVLKMGARVIELDCFAKNNIGKTEDDFIPIVAHGLERKSGDIFSTSTILFEDCIDQIVKYGFLTSDPLIICLELNTNNMLSTQKIMKNIIKSKLGEKLLNFDYKIGNKKNRKYFINEPIKNLLNKVIFISGSGYTEELTDIIDGTFDELNILTNNSSNLIIDENNVNKLNQINRIYPHGDLSGHLSYNYDPVYFWKNKCQMVALNFQVLDDNLLKNVAMFKSYSFVHFSEFS